MRAEPVTRTKVQRLVTVTFAAAGAVLVVAMLVGVPDSIVRWLKFVPIAALPVVALASRPVGASKYLDIVAMALSAVGDAFFLGFLPAAGGRNRIAGIATFSVAYLFLIAAFWRGRPARRELRFAVPLAMLGFGIVAALWQFANPLMRAMVPVFTVIIVTMAWTTLATRNRGHFASNAARLIAPVGPTLVASDIVVGLHVFHPAFTPTPMPSELFVRVTYLTGWLLVLLFVLSPKTALVRGIDGPSRA